MKVALILSGQPRNIHFGYNFYYETILKHYDVDVFSHTWFDSENLSTQSILPGRQHIHLDPHAIEHIHQLYSPKKIIIEKPKIWNEICVFTDKVFTHAHTWAPQHNIVEEAKKYCSNVTHSMYYSIMMSNLVKEQFSLENNIQYDVVIRGRFDCAPKNIVQLKNHDFSNNIFYYQDLYQPDQMISDWFGMGNSKVMNYYSCVYNRIPYLINQSIEIDGYWCNELLLKHHFLNSKIIPTTVDYNVYF